MNILAVETSSDACSCALWCRGGLVERCEIAPRRHTALLLPMVDAVLAEAGIALPAVDLLAYGRGPGSFTGVRIASSVVQGLALAVDRPVLALSSLAGVATAGGRPGERVLAAFDARLGEVYLGAFEIGGRGLASAAGAEQLASPDRAALPEAGSWIGIGHGWLAHGERLRERLGDRLAESRPQVLPTAGALARLAAAADPADARPAAEAGPGYLRREVATPPRARGS